MRRMFDTHFKRVHIREDAKAQPVSSEEMPKANA
jgi:hypothetical protein